MQTLTDHFQSIRKQDGILQSKSNTNLLRPALCFCSLSSASSLPILPSLSSYYTKAPKMSPHQRLRQELSKAGRMMGARRYARSLRHRQYTRPPRYTEPLPPVLYVAIGISTTETKDRYSHRSCISPPKVLTAHSRRNQQQQPQQQLVQH